jgi:hypothetical protein
MSEYVEARYAKLVLREARLAEEDVASKLINELLHDLKSFQNLNSARAQRYASSRSVLIGLNRFMRASGRPLIKLPTPGAGTRFIEKIVLQVRDGPWRGQRRHWQQRTESDAGVSHCARTVHQMLTKEFYLALITFLGGDYTIKLRAAF